ncbi:MAG TPA: ion channel [Candidatus Dormibacteraeota bacterium]
MVVLEYLAVAAGVVLLAITFYDLFQTVVLPRPAVRKYQLARLIVRPMWRIWKWVSLRSSRIDRSESRMASFAPIALILLVLIWAMGLIVGYALLEYGVREQFEPVMEDFPEAIYVSAATLVPLAFGDIIPTQGIARLIIVLESANGVAFGAAAITLLFELYGSFRAREEAVVALDALAGAPASAVQLLETAAKPGMDGILRETFEEWRKWSAMVLESHLAYPLLIYFRSSHDNEAWINSFGAVMDASTLILSSVEAHESAGSAKLMATVGDHLVEDITWLLFRASLEPEPIIERSEYEAAIARLRAAGYNAHDGDVHWQKFVAMRSKYAMFLNRMAQLLSAPPAPWVGDRSYVPHRERPRRHPVSTPAS